jgi:hypothetical protein
MTFKRKPYMPAPSAPLAPLRIRLNYAKTEVAVPQPKERTYRSEKWLSAVRALEYCVLCGKHGVEAAHRNEGKSMASKTDDCLTAALCRPCHVAIDQGSEMVREERRSLLDSAILLTLVALARKGVVKV